MNKSYNEIENYTDWENSVENIDEAWELFWELRSDRNSLLITLNSTIEKLYEDLHLLKDKDHIAYSCMVDTLRGATRRMELGREILDKPLEELKNRE
jgi:hypothetical protein